VASAAPFRRIVATEDANKPAAGNAGIASRLAIEHHWPGVPDPERSSRRLCGGRNGVGRAPAVPPRKRGGTTGFVRRPCGGQARLRASGAPAPIPWTRFARPWNAALTSFVSLSFGAKRASEQGHFTNMGLDVRRLRLLSSGPSW